MAKTGQTERLARRLVAELGQRPKERPWADVEKLQERLGLDQRQIAQALLVAAEQGWIKVDPLAAQGKACPHSVTVDMPFDPTATAWTAEAAATIGVAGIPRWPADRDVIDLP